MADIFVQCPRTGTPISTGLRSEWVLLKSLPRVPIPVHCPACGQTHTWDAQDAWIGPVLRSRDPRRLSGSRAASWSAPAVDAETTPKRLGAEKKFEEISSSRLRLGKAWNCRAKAEPESRSNQSGTIRPGNWRRDRSYSANAAATARLSLSAPKISTPARGCLALVYF